MERKPVASTVLAEVGYDEPSGVLEVQFRSGRVYRYFQVPRTAYRALMKAESIGGYFNREIKTRYRGVMVS